MTALFQNCLPASPHDQSTTNDQWSRLPPVSQLVALRKTGHGKLRPVNENAGICSPNWSRLKLTNLSRPSLLSLTVPGSRAPATSPPASTSTSLSSLNPAPIISTKKGRTVRPVFSR